VIALADAPDWSFEPFAGWLAAMTGVAVVGQYQSDIGKALATFLLLALALSKGPVAATKLAGLTK
jgi:hypothetical protein